MSMLLQKLMGQIYMAPAGDDGAAGGGAAVDRGDDVAGHADGGAGHEDDDAGHNAADLDEEGDETAEERVAREAEEAAARDAAEAKKRIRIPKSRFDEAMNKARDREARLQAEIDRLTSERESNRPSPDRVIGETRANISELEDKYEDLLTEGKKDEARSVRRQINAMREQLSDYTSSLKADQARLAAIDQLTYNSQLAGLEGQYPALNPDSEFFDEDKTDEVANLMQVLAGSGMTRADALQRACRYVLGAPVTGDRLAAAEDVAAKRERAARAKAADANRRQPPAMGSVGDNNDRGVAGEVDLAHMTQKQFAKLDEDTKARLRGDVL